MATKKTAAKQVEEVEVVEEESSDEVALVEETVVDAEPDMVPFTPANTWTLYYGNALYDFTEGVTKMVPAEVGRYLKRHQLRTY